MGLRLADIAYAYGAGTSFEQSALRGVSLSVEPGELVLVVGSTGSGKSTLMRVASGLLEPGSGTAEIDGQPLGRHSARGRVGLVFQDAESQLFAETVAEDVAFGPRNLGVPESEIAQRVAEALEAVGLEPDEYGPRSTFQLSGGEARRAAMAGVLAMRPRYLLADEPTAGLDALGRAAVREVVASARKATGVVVVTHSAEEFLAAADKVLVLDGGRSAWSGTASHLVSDPTPLTAAGLRPPDVLALQVAARDRGIEVGEFTLDPELAARRLARAGGWY